jgi:hypothetical protein
MLGVKKYSNGYINSCRKKAKADIDAFEKITSSSEIFEAVYFNNMALVLEHMFVHRMRGQEGKDGNPLNEVRMISHSILTNNNKLLADNTIKYIDSKSVLKISLEQVISLTAKDFIKLSKRIL